MSKLISNYLFNSFYQILILIIPFITMPYVARVLSPDGLGVSAYSLSVAQIFVLFAVLGIPLYGSKQIAIAKIQGKEKISVEFWSIYLIQLIASLLCSLIFLLMIHIFFKDQSLIYFLQWFNIIAAMVDISWLFIGLEELKKTVIRNTLTKVAGVALIFIFVKDQDDLITYIAINALTNLIGQLILWVQSKEYIGLPRFGKKNVLLHLKPIFVIFIPQIIIQLYVVLDKIILGTLSNEEEVAMYDQGLKIVKMSLALVTSVVTVMLPRISSEFNQGNKDKFKYYVDYVLKFILFMTIPMCIGLACIANNFVGWFFGPGYEKVGLILILLSPIVIIIGLSSVFGMQILLPTNQQNKLTISVTIGAAVSILTNIALIPFFDSVGAAIATVLAEITVTIVQFIFVKEYIHLKQIIKENSPYLFSSIVMGGVILLLGIYVNVSPILKTIIQLAIGLATYSLLLLIMKDKFLLDVKNKIFIKR
ncbi:O-antigen/teichoic acid export membrane protein [Neobacillus niacini]|uniref:flippase n=1 Tax=Neobacillus niacini TaxID=86668 RepID=UPI00278A9590|nr:flippase [Neobacillus niacini]MDQ1000805.1 O-antigen/teichoic acid export membrane protein [Neobacillus niacini]